MKKPLTFFIAICLVLSVAFSVNNLVLSVTYDKNLTEIFVSPYSNILVTVKYDYASRPFVFLGNEMIFDYSSTGKSGFNETVDFNVEWVSENQIRLFCSQHTEEYFISIE